MMKYIEKSANNEYTFAKMDDEGRYVLERNLNKDIKNGKIVKETVTIPEDVLNEYFELKEGE